MIRYFLAVLAAFAIGCSDEGDGLLEGEGSFGPTISGQVSGPGGPLEGALVAGIAWVENNCGGPGGVFDMNSVRTASDGTYEFNLRSGGGGTQGTSVGFLCIVIVAEPPLAMALATDTVEIMNYEVFLFVPQEIEANFVLQPLAGPQ